MFNDPSSAVRECNPEECYAALSASEAALIDVRTRPEWAFVGVPDLSGLGKQAFLVEWQSYPDMGVNQGFLDQLTTGLGGRPPKELHFICRSGARSLSAARAAASAFRDAGFDVACINVAEGFEGDLDPDGRRGRVNGWKARGLPWRQS